MIHFHHYRRPLIKGIILFESVWMPFNLKSLRFYILSLIYCTLMNSSSSAPPDMTKPIILALSIPFITDIGKSELSPHLPSATWLTHPIHILQQQQCVCIECVHVCIYFLYTYCIGVCVCGLDCDRFEHRAADRTERHTRLNRVELECECVGESTMDASTEPQQQQQQQQGKPTSRLAQMQVSGGCHASATLTHLPSSPHHTATPKHVWRNVRCALCN